jgi:4-amino-4-deoxychorismate lyase
MRELIIEQARDILGGCRIRHVPLVELVEATEVFLTNSLIGIWPVRRIDWNAPHGDIRHYRQGPITRQLKLRIATAVPPP